MEAGPVCKTLAAVYASELTAITTYSVHAAVCEVWGYPKLRDAFMDSAKEEMKHLHVVTERMVQLGDIPPSVSIEMRDCASVPVMMQTNIELEKKAIDDLNEYMKCCIQCLDLETYRIYQHLLADETEHHTYLDAQLKQIKDMTLSNYLSAQV